MNNKWIRSFAKGIILLIVCIYIVFCEFFVLKALTPGGLKDIHDMIFF
ncbi:hypothetical protein MOB49_17700 [Bacillus haynesii]|nr:MULTISPECIES: hypothetical protein [Bacillus]MCY7968880.1 hypothetical protein [Bacillus haynesii]MCY8102310.1 hypothetical protein [Bacillus haynesii]MCY8665205.1 hypothetical protein [Bacillus haynesii]MEC1050895.1 hypothetical protein [Bacillus paralicheniformis]MEC1087730.1 hypothetical protein [Bacillus paralicheniformis]